MAIPTILSSSSSASENESENKSRNDGDNESMSGALSEHSDGSESEWSVSDEEKHSVSSEDDDEDGDGSEDFVDGDSQPPAAKKPKLTSESTTEKWETELPASSLKRKSRVKTTPKRADAYPPKARNSNPGWRRVGKRIYDSVLGKTCHWCRQKTVELHVECATCPIRFCGMCLLNRNGEKIEQEMLVLWICPKCRGGCGPGCKNCCNCGPCRKAQGLAPTGQVINVARKAGFSDAHDYLVHLKSSGSPADIAQRKEGRKWTRDTGAHVRTNFLSRAVKDEVEYEEETVQCKVNEESDLCSPRVGKENISEVKISEDGNISDESSEERICDYSRVEKNFEESRKKSRFEERLFDKISVRPGEKKTGEESPEGKTFDEPLIERSCSPGVENLFRESRQQKIFDEPLIEETSVIPEAEKASAHGNDFARGLESSEERICDYSRVEKNFEESPKKSCFEERLFDKISVRPGEKEIGEESPKGKTFDEPLIERSCSSGVENLFRESRQQKIFDGPLIEETSVIPEAEKASAHGNDFDRGLAATLRRPYSTPELKEMWEQFTFRKCQMKLRQTRSRTFEVPGSVQGLSYKDHYPDLAEKLKMSTSPGEKFRLLLGFFFWVQHTCTEGAYRPWRSAPVEDGTGECTEVDPDCEILRVQVAIDEDDDKAFPEWEGKKFTRRFAAPKNFMAPNQSVSQFPVKVKQEAAPENCMGPTQLVSRFPVKVKQERG